MASYPVGTCNSMCTSKQARDRTSILDIDPLEYVQPQKSHSHDRQFVLIQRFERSEAGKVIHPEDIRTESALISTVDYLFQTVLVRKDVPLMNTYSF